MKHLKIDCRKYLVSFFIAACCLLLTAYSFSQIADCLVAVVNDQVITLTDIKIVNSLKLYEKEVEGTAGNLFFLILEKVIDQKVVIDMAGEKVAVGRDELEFNFRSLLQKLGPEQVERTLGEFGLDLDDLRAYLEERLLFQKIISLRFSQSAIVSLKEIEDYYRRIYVPSQAQKGLEPESMVQLIDEIESKIREEKITQQVALWIRSLKNQAEIEIKYDWLRQKITS